MEDVNKITATRQLILHALQELVAGLDFGSDSLEAEIGPDTMVYVQLLCNDYDDYYEMEIQEVCVNKDTYRRECELPNISEFIYRKLCKEVKAMNREAYEDYVYS